MSEEQPITPVVTPEVTPEPVKEPVAPTLKEPVVTPPTPTPEPQFVEVDGQKVSVDELKGGYMRQKDYTQKTQQLVEKSREIEDLKTKFSRIEGAFAPPVSEPPVTPQYITEDKLNEIVTQALTDQEKKTVLQNEIKSLEKELSGEDGRPKYIDQEILDWQRANGKMYLAPREAYKAKYENELLDWEVKKRLSSAGQPITSEKPGGTTPVNVPQKKSSFVKEGVKGKLEIDEDARKQAILETMENSEKEI